MGDLQVAIGTGGLDPKKHGCCLDLRLATISLDKKQCQSDKKPKNLHYIFESGVPQSPAAPLQNLIVPKKIAAACRRWVKAYSLGKISMACRMPHCAGLSAVKANYGYRAYDVFRLEDGAWVWCGYGNGRAVLPKSVRKRLAEGRPAECVVEGYRYCIKPPSRGENRTETPAKKSGSA